MDRLQLENSQGYAFTIWRNTTFYSDLDNQPLIETFDTLLQTALLQHSKVQIE